ncbi:MAG: CapA family protein [Fibrobacter sp.]|nr:CapA family protein [Fibrobacter sp.]
MCFGIGFLIFFVLLLAYVYSPFKRPFLTESDWETKKTPWWQLYYSSRFLCPVKRPARKSGLEKLFLSDMSPRESVPLNDEKTVVVKAVGDLMSRRDLLGDGGKTLWDYAGEYVFSGDLRLANFEFAVNPNVLIEKMIRYSVPESYALPLLSDERFGKFDCVFLANNHTNDSLSGGIIETCNFLDRVNVRFTGAGRTPEETAAFPIFDYDGLKVAVLSYTFSTNGVPLEPDFQHGLNVVRFNALNDDDYDPSVIFDQVAKAKQMGADIVIVSNHWGVEFEYYPSERLVRRAHELCDHGVDIIIGHHPHIINMSERYRASDGREAVILYSLGNATCSWLPFTYQKMGEAVEICLKTGFDKNNNRVTTVGDVTLRPMVHVINKKHGVKYHAIMPLFSTVDKIKEGENIEFLTGKNKRMLFKAYREYKKHFIQKGFKYI